MKWIKNMDLESLSGNQEISIAETTIRMRDKDMGQ
jgi:hypothetical protein